MKSTLTLVLAVCMLFGVAAAVAATAPATGKVITVDGDKVQIALDGAKPDWVEMEASVKFKEGIGKIVAVSAPDVTPVAITVKTSKAASLKVGSTLSLEKGKAPRSGC